MKTKNDLTYHSFAFKRIRTTWGQYYKYYLAVIFTMIHCIFLHFSKMLNLSNTTTAEKGPEDHSFQCTTFGNHWSRNQDFSNGRKKSSSNFSGEVEIVKPVSQRNPSIILSKITQKNLIYITQVQIRHWWKKGQVFHWDV